MIWGPSPWTQKPALKNVIFASHGVGNGNLCPLYCRRGRHKGEKYILLLQAYFMTIKGEAAKTQLSHIIDLHREGTGLLHMATLSHNHILFFGSIHEMLKTGRAAHSDKRA